MQLTFFVCVWLLLNECAVASEKILTTASERKNVQLLLRNYVNLKNILKRKQIKIKMMKRYSSPRKPITFMYFWLNYCNGNHIERIPIAVTFLPFYVLNEIIEADRLHLFLLSDGTRIDHNDYLSSLENGTELIVCTESKSINC